MGNEVLEPTRPEIVDIKEATLSQLICLLEDEDTLPFYFDKSSTEEALKRLETLIELERPFGETAEKSETLRSHLRFFLRKQHAVEHPDLKEVLSFSDLQIRTALLGRNDKTLDELIEANTYPDRILEYPGAALLGMEMKKREWLLEPLIKQESSAMLYADTGVGKTWLSWELIVAIAGGGEFAGWKAEKPRRVLVVDGEMNMGELRERFSATLQRQANPSVMDKATQNITLIPRQAQNWRTKFYDLDDSTYQAKLLERLDYAKSEEKRPYDLVVLDNFSCLAEIEDENSASAFNGICQFLNRAKTMTTVLLVHHTGKNSSSRAEGMTYRGSSKLGGIMEVCIALGKPSGADIPDHNGAAFKLRIEKYRGLKHATLEPRVFSLNPEENTWAIKGSEEEVQNKYLEALKTGNYDSYSSIGKAVGGDRSTVMRNIKKLVKQGVLTAKEVERYTSKVIELPDDGELDSDEY